MILCRFLSFAIEGREMRMKDKEGRGRLSMPRKRGDRLGF